MTPWQRYGRTGTYSTMSEKGPDPHKSDTRENYNRLRVLPSTVNPIKALQLVGHLACP